MSKKIGLIIFVCLFCVAVSGCGQKSYVENKVEKELEKNLGGKVDVDVDDNAVEIETEDGGLLQAGENVSLPDDFPEDVYICEGQIMSVAQNLGVAGFQIVIKSSDETQALGEIYKEKLAEQGWEIISTFGMGDAYMISAKKGDRSVTVTIGVDEDGEGTNVILNVS